MSTERVEHEGRLLAEILRNDIEVDRTTFFSSPESALQIGIMRHPKGFKENPHFHPVGHRAATQTQQFFIVIRGIVIVDFFDLSGTLWNSVELHVGDSILIIEGVHSIRVNESSKCVTIKQGPFRGSEPDKIDVKP